MQDKNKELLVTGFVAGVGFTLAQVVVSTTAGLIAGAAHSLAGKDKNRDSKKRNSKKLATNKASSKKRAA